QLLCEQVVGRGLRRTSYEIDEKTGLFAPEYVNIFGVPFTFLPHEGTGDGPPPPPPSPKTRIEAMPDRKAYEIAWPNVIRIDHEYRPELTLDLPNTPLLTLDAYDVPTIAELAPIIEGKPDRVLLKSICASAAKSSACRRIFFALQVTYLIKCSRPGKEVGITYWRS